MQNRLDSYSNDSDDEGQILLHLSVVLLTSRQEVLLSAKFISCLFVCVIEGVCGLYCNPSFAEATNGRTDVGVHVL